jgi:hypothetical protein
MRAWPGQAHPEVRQNFRKKFLMDAVAAMRNLWVLQHHSAAKVLFYFIVLLTGSSSKLRRAFDSSFELNCGGHAKKFSMGIIFPSLTAKVPKYGDSRGNTETKGRNADIIIRAGA